MKTQRDGVFDDYTGPNPGEPLPFNQPLAYQRFFHRMVNQFNLGDVLLLPSEDPQDQGSWRIVEVCKMPTGVYEFDIAWLFADASPDFNPRSLRHWNVEVIRSVPATREAPEDHFEESIGEVKSGDLSHAIMIWVDGCIGAIQRGIFEEFQYAQEP